MTTYNKEYYENNKERFAGWHKKWYNENKEQEKARVYFWMKNTLRGKLNSILGGIRFRCKRKYAHNYKNYGGKGITCCLTVDDLLRLWKRDGAERMEKPSIDRKDSNKNYTFKNCRFIEHRINSGNHG